MIDFAVGRSALVVLLFWVGGSPAFAEAVPRPFTIRAVQEERRCASVPVVLAGGWSIGTFLASGGRARIVQICVVAMCIALFIMMRKLF
jgi:hypothetical protein